MQQTKQYHLKKGEHRVHEQHSEGLGTRCSEGRMRQVTTQLPHVTCRRCIVMRECDIEVKQPAVLKDIAIVAHSRAFRKFPEKSARFV